jgi:hypothetical protein
MKLLGKTAVRQGLRRLSDQFRPSVPVAATPAPAEQTETPVRNMLLEGFLARARAMPAPRVLELGTMRSIPGRSTKHDVWLPNASAYLGTDIAPGEDVDIVADIHRLTQVTGEEAFDVIVSCSSFEHFKYPHLAAHEVMKALKVGGCLFIQTHQSFPLHAYPYDYFRFSQQAMNGLFGTRMGFQVIHSDYDFPVQLHSKRIPGIENQPAFLNVNLFGAKTGKTPNDYIYEFDVD